MDFVINATCHACVKVYMMTELRREAQKSGWLTVGRLLFDVWRHP
jgi:hypothetical protein